MRVRRGTKRANRRKKILKQAKGFYGGKSRNFRVAKEAVERAMQFAYRDRRNRKRDFRRLWIVRINAGARLNGMSYNSFIHGLQKAGCELNRKMLADLAARDPESFAELANVARAALDPDQASAVAAPAESEPVAAAAEAKPKPKPKPKPVEAAPEAEAKPKSKPKPKPAEAAPKAEAKAKPEAKPEPEPAAADSEPTEA